MALPVQFSVGTPPVSTPADTWPERLNGMQEGGLEGAPVTFGSSGAPDVSGTIAVSFLAASGIVKRALYVVIWLGANGTVTLNAMEPGVLSSATIEVHHVGAARTLAFKSGGVGALTEGGAGLALSTTGAGVMDVVYLWTPDGGASLRGSIAKGWS